MTLDDLAVTQQPYRAHVAFSDGQSDKYHSMRTPPRPHRPDDDARHVLTPTADLGLAVLIAEDAEDHYQPIAVVGTIREAIEISNHELRRRCLALELGMDPVCPSRYVVWAQQHDGRYERVYEISVTVPRSTTP